MHSEKPSDPDLNAALERLSNFIDQNSSQGETFVMKESREEAGEREGEDNSIVNSMRMIANLLQTEERVEEQFHCPSRPTYPRLLPPVL